MKTLLITLAAALFCFMPRLIAGSPNVVFILADDQAREEAAAD